MNLTVKSRPQGNCFWVRAEGDIINVDEMNESHLRNALKKLMKFHHKGPVTAAVICDTRTPEEKVKHLKPKKSCIKEKQNPSGLLDPDDPQYLPF